MLKTQRHLIKNHWIYPKAGKCDPQLGHNPPVTGTAGGRLRDRDFNYGHHEAMLSVLKVLREAQK